MRSYTCPQCGAAFERHESQVTAKAPKCSRRCAFEALRLLAGENSPSWKGGVGTPTRGYLVVNKRGTVYLVHRLVMEEHIGRPLLKGEVVHHINGNRSDNRIENLVLCQTQAEHNSSHHVGDTTRGKCIHCDRPERAKGLCDMHYKRKRRGVPMEQPFRTRRHLKST